MKFANILLVDDHALLRAGLRVILKALPRVAEVIEAENGLEAIERIAATRPDVVFMDIGMPELNGLDALSHITKTFPGTRVVILTMHANQEYAIKAMRTGAAGYVLKNSKPSELQQAIEIVLSGDTYLCPKISKSLDEYLHHSDQSKNCQIQLTPRQTMTLQLLAEGQSTKGIANSLKISGKTVEKHRTQLMARLQIRDLAGLVRYAVRNGFVDSGKQ